MPLQCLKKVSNKTEQSEALFPAIQKDEESALFFNSSNSIIPSKKFNLKKNYLKLIISFNLSNKSRKTFSKEHQPETI